MLFLLSPAKTLDYESPLPRLPHTRPRFVAQSQELIAVLRGFTPAGVAGLMSLSDSLAALNVARYHAWSPRFTAANSRQAVLAFNGDVYEGLGARSLSTDDLAWAQDHLRILSGLYGLLRPLDRIQPYRLEMGTALQVGEARNLYQFWGTRIAHALNRELAAQKTPVVVNLSSQEYSKAVDRGALKARMVECIFEEGRGGGWKIVSFSAKRARGLMARYAIAHRLATPAQLRDFGLEGWSFDAGVSAVDRLVFRRKAGPG